MIEINRFRIFTLSEARKILPLISRITLDSKNRVQSLMDQLERQNTLKRKIDSQLEEQINLQVELWQEKLGKLGIRAQGLWIADFDSEDGYFCWRWPETTIEYWHGYNEGFSGRIPISDWERRQKRDPIDLIRDQSAPFTI